MGLLLIAAVLTCPSAPQDAFIDDFESPALDRWERVWSDRHPPYNTAELVRDPAAAKSGSQFLRFVSQGGSTALRREAWPVNPALPYRLSAYARLRGTRRNAARVTLVWLDASGDPISESRSAPARQTGTWTELSVEVLRVPAGAVSAAVRLDFEGDDVRGECDFDLVRFGPEMAVEVLPADRAVALYRPDEAPRFSVWVGGAPAGSHELSLRMKPPEGSGMSRSARVTLPEAPSARIDFPPLGAGAHQLEAFLDGRPIGREIAVLVPNPWLTPGDRVPVPALLAAPGPPDSAEILAVAGLAPVEGPASAGAASIEEAVRQRLAGPEAPVVFGGLYVDSRGEPQPALLALRAANDFLSGALPQAQPEFLPPGVRGMAVRKGDRAALALWTEGGPAEVAIDWGPQARLYPPLGAVRQLRPGEPVRVDRLAVFVFDLDPLLFDLRVALVPGGLPLQRTPILRKLRVTNASGSRTLRGVHLRVEGFPAGWQVAPAQITAEMILPGSALAEDIRLTLPDSELPGPKSIHFELRFTDQDREKSIHLSETLELRPELEIQASVEDGPVKGSRKLIAKVHNASERTMNCSLRVRVPQWPEQLELLRPLSAGASSSPFEYVVKNARLLDPSRLQAELEVQEALGDRAFERKVIPLK